MRSFRRLLSRRKGRVDVPTLSFSDSRLDLALDPAIVDFANSARLLDEPCVAASSTTVVVEELSEQDVVHVSNHFVDRMLRRIGPYVSVGFVRNYPKIVVARHAETGRLVAIKQQEMHSPRLKDGVYRPIHETTISQMLSDAQLQQMPGHRYIVGFVGHATCFKSNLHLLVTEYCEAGNLFDFFNGCGACASTRQRLGLAKDFTAALQYIHSLKVAHRDIKHENMFLAYSVEEERYVVKVGDFGASSFTSDGCSFRVKPGSPFYAAPELLVAGDYLPQPVDVWAYGVAVYVMFEMQYPFEIGTDDGRFASDAIVTIVDQLGELSFSNPSIQKLIGPLINDIFQYEPKNRPDMNSIARSPFFATHSAPITRHDFATFLAQHRAAKK